MKIAGMDEAGKGPVIGPLVVGIFCCENKAIDDLKRLGIKDSKKLTHKRRLKLYEKLVKLGDFDVIKIQAKDLDKLMEKMTINEILKSCYEELINRIDANIYILDSPDVIPKRISSELRKATGKNVEAYHKADEKFEVVSAASIIAKVEREKEIEKIKKELGDFGSGYASDEKTIRFLKDWLERNGKFPPHTRMRWKTVSNLMQKSLNKFFK